jgi:GNAT superfamily N-acetyltransferase
MVPVLVKELPRSEWAPALQLAKKVFLVYEAPDYPPEGITSFSACLQDEAFLSRLRIYAAMENGVPVGMLATRSGGSHIALFFVDGAYHRRGIGRALFYKACGENAPGRMTVNSSPYAQEVYHSFGFADTDMEQTVDGLRFIPMTCALTPNHILALKKRSFSLPFDDAEIWCEHLDGLGAYSALVREKFAQDWAQIRRPSNTSLLAINLDETQPDGQITADICHALCSGEKRFMRVCFVGLSRAGQAAFAKGLKGAAFGLHFTADFQLAKEWLVHGRA